MAYYNKLKEINCSDLQNPEMEDTAFPEIIKFYFEHTKQIQIINNLVTRKAIYIAAYVMLAAFTLKITEKIIANNEKISKMLNKISPLLLEYAPLLVIWISLSIPTIFFFNKIGNKDNLAKLFIDDMTNIIVTQKSKEN